MSRSTTEGVPPAWYRKYHGPILFCAGLLGIAYETLVEHSDRPYLLALFGGMVGLPFLTTGATGRSTSDPPTPPPRRRRRIDMMRAVYVCGWAGITFGLWATQR